MPSVSAEGRSASAFQFGCPQVFCFVFAVIRLFLLAVGRNAYCFCYSPLFDFLTPIPFFLGYNRLIIAFYEHICGKIVIKYSLLFKIVVAVRFSVSLVTHICRVINNSRNYAR